MLQIANRWFERKHISDDITLIWEPHVHPLLRCNIWLVRGRDEDLLVDTGLGVASLKSHLEDLLDKPVLAVATHIHYDHVGSLHEFEHRLMHAIEAPRMADYQEYQPLRLDAFPAEFLEGYEDPSFDEFLISAAPDERFSVDTYAIQSTPPSRTLLEGDVLDLGNRNFEVLHLPGHSPGSMALYEHATQTLFSGDAIYDGPLLDELPDSSIPDYVATMKRLRKLPVRVVHGGHERSFGRERLVEIIDEYLSLRA